MEKVPEAPPPPEPPPLPPPPEPPPEPVHPDDLPRSKKPLKLKEKVPHFGSVSEADGLFASVPEREPGDTALDSEDEELHPWTPSLRQKLELQASSLKHQLTHFPKNRYCEVCRRSKMQAKTHRKKGLEVDPEEMPPLHYGHRIRADHIIIGKDLSKGSEGEEACLVCLDEYSGCLQAFPQTSRTTDKHRSIASVRWDKGTWESTLYRKDRCSSRAYRLKYLGWLPSPSVPNDPVHNAKLERSIRSIKEGARAILLKSGLDHQHWPRAVEYFCVAHAITNQAQIHPNESDEKKIDKSTQTCYEAAAGEAFTGLRLPFGALYTTNLQSTVNSPHSSQEHIQASLWVRGLTQGFITEMSIWFLITRISFQKLRVVVDPFKSTSLSLLNPPREIVFFHCSKQR